MNAEKLRFDFHHDGALGRERLQALEAEVNRAILANLPVAKHVDVPVDEAKAQVNETLQSIASQIDALTEKAKQAQRELEELMLSVPNMPAPEVPAGASEDDNVEVARWGTPREFEFLVKDHVELGEGIGQLDADTGSKITGSRFTVMYGELARMHRALIQFMMDLHTSEHGYQEIYVPFIAWDRAAAQI